ncbi:uncharacterized protein METZ01_LOCUS394778 [marine metagenome]|uniref:Uncharacterized protein n=1 Tax=marine metagenome TaxID=408172 RepID=A0A382V608_9ZZZZ
MSDKIYLPMTPEVRDELRYAMNTQFRYKLYRDTVFPFLHSMGIRHIIQGFEAKEELGFIGVLQLWYENNSGELSYQTKDKHFLAGDWKHEWLDKPEDAIELAIQIQKDKPYDEDKLIQIAIEYARKAAEKHVKKLVEDHLEKEEPPKLLN